MMSLYELWAHNMFPSMAFPDMARRIETLGTKRPVQVRYHFGRSVQILNLSFCIILGVYAKGEIG